jgi:hypothetical protein
MAGFCAQVWMSFHFGAVPQDDTIKGLVETPAASRTDAAEPQPFSAIFNFSLTQYEGEHTNGS